MYRCPNARGESRCDSPAPPDTQTCRHMRLGVVTADCAIVLPACLLISTMTW
eukprot:m.1061333 g.1061333  ORF g.1061333 m.1061333 type:complete len:52 (+) comp24211_c0_seq2:4606-4761(+)